jgi:hypothetical protein
MPDAGQMGMFAEPVGELVCDCSHDRNLHSNGGRGDCRYSDCSCMRFRASGVRAEPRARTTDPETSHAAAASVRNPTANQAAVLRVLKNSGPITDETLVRAYTHNSHNNMNLPQQSESGIRTRRKELVDARLVAAYDKVRGSTGRMMTRWRAVECRV